jgi:hypothetical protein
LANPVTDISLGFAEIPVEILLKRFGDALKSLEEQICISNISGAAIHSVLDELLLFSRRLRETVLGALREIEGEQQNLSVGWYEVRKGVSSREKLALPAQIGISQFFEFLANQILNSREGERIQRALFMEYFLFTCGFIEDIMCKTPDLKDIAKLAIFKTTNADGILKLGVGYIAIAECLIRLSQAGEDLTFVKLADHLPHLALQSYSIIAIRDFSSGLANELRKQIGIPTLEEVAKLAGKKVPNRLLSKLGFSRKQMMRAREELCWLQVFKWWHSELKNENFKGVSLFADANIKFMLCTSILWINKP